MCITHPYTQILNIKKYMMYQYPYNIFSKQKYAMNNYSLKRNIDQLTLVCLCAFQPIKISQNNLQ